MDDFVALILYYDKYDYLIGMDCANIRNMTRICRGEPKGKIYKLLSFADSDRDVTDQPKTELLHSVFSSFLIIYHFKVVK